MRLLVCGGRDFIDGRSLFAVLDAEAALCADNIEIIHGGARGADSLAGEWAAARGRQVQVFPANWELHGRSAGPRRNKQMLAEGRPDLVVAFPGGRGTAHMVRLARERGVPVREVPR